VAPTFTIDDVDIPLPDNPNGISVEHLQFGTERRMLSGELRVQYIATKRRWKLSWSILSQDDRDICYTAYTDALYTALEMVLPTDIEETVYVMSGVGTWSESLVAEGDSWIDPDTEEEMITPYYDISFVLNEA
jgi:hypothetical protein